MVYKVNSLWKPIFFFLWSVNYQETMDEVGERTQTMKMEGKIYNVTGCGNKVLAVRKQFRYWGHSMPARWGSNGGKEPWSLQEETWSTLVLMFSKFVLMSFYFSLLHLHVITLLHLTNVNSFLIWCFWTGYMMFNDQKEVLHGLSIWICTINSHRLIHLQTIIMLCASVSPLSWMFLL